MLYMSICWFHLHKSENCVSLKKFSLMFLKM